MVKAEILTRMTKDVTKPQRPPAVAHRPLQVSEQTGKRVGYTRQLYRKPRYMRQHA